MPPPKAKLHKTTGKSRSGPPQIMHNNQNDGETQPSTSTGSPTTGLTFEQEQQFEAELYWCIQQLQVALSSNKLNNKQVQDHTKALNTLMSNTAPMIKKRQVMRVSFGDYRGKMEAEEKKAKKITMKVLSAKPNQKSMFIRKAIITPSQNDFKFNFPSTENDSAPKANGYSEKIEADNTTFDKNENPAFVKSDNSFRFNFSINEYIDDQ